MELLGLIFGGGATGLLGTLFGRVFNFVDRWQEQKYVLEKYRLDAEMRARETEGELAIAETKGYADTLTASYAHDTGVGRASRWVVDILRLVRPGLTVLLWVLVGLIWFSVSGQNTELPWLLAKVVAIKEQIIGTILYCATAATLWWFGTRDMRKQP